jgi:hypothetical protein
MKNNQGRCYDFFAENIDMSWSFLSQNKAKLCKNFITTLVFEKNANFCSQKIGESRRKL